MPEYAKVQLNRGSASQGGGGGGSGIPDGVVFVPTVTDEGIISWTNNGDLPNPQTANIKGPQGNPGTNGKSAYQIALDNGFVGTEQEWLASLQGSDGDNGTDGKSAYQIAVENGYSGTEVQWLASLKGDKGDKGDDGDPYTPVIGNVTTTSSVSEATAQVRLNTAEKLAYFDFTLPRGEKGLDGKGQNTVVQSYLYANQWDSETNEYSFQNTYPKEVYRMEIELDGDRASASQYAMYGAAKIVGSYSDNKCKALGELPTSNLPIVITLENIGNWADVTPDSIQILNAPTYPFIEGTAFALPQGIQVKVTMESGKVVDVTNEIQWTPAPGTILTTNINTVQAYYENAAGHISANMGIVVKPRSQVGWQGGTDAEITGLLNEYYTYGTDISAYFQVGDIREVQLTNGATVHMVLLKEYATPYYDDNLDSVGSSIFLVGIKEAFITTTDFEVAEVEGNDIRNAYKELEVPDTDGTFTSFYDLLPSSFKEIFKTRQLSYKYIDENRYYYYTKFSHPCIDIAGIVGHWNVPYGSNRYYNVGFDDSFREQANVSNGGYYDEETTNSNRYYTNIYDDTETLYRVFAHGNVHIVGNVKYAAIYDAESRMSGPAGNASYPVQGATVVGVI